MSRQQKWYHCSTPWDNDRCRHGRPSQPSRSKFRCCRWPRWSRIPHWMTRCYWSLEEQPVPGRSLYLIQWPRMLPQPFGPSRVWMALCWSVESIRTTNHCLGRWNLASWRTWDRTGSEFCCRHWALARVLYRRLALLLNLPSWKDSNGKVVAIPLHEQGRSGCCSGRVPFSRNASHPSQWWRTPALPTGPDIRREALQSTTNASFRNAIRWNKMLWWTYSWLAGVYRPRKSDDGEWLTLVDLTPFILDL